MRNSTCHHTFSCIADHLIFKTPSMLLNLNSFKILKCRNNIQAVQSSIYYSNLNMLQKSYLGVFGSSFVEFWHGELGHGKINKWNIFIGLIVQIKSVV